MIFSERKWLKLSTSTFKVKSHGMHSTSQEISKRNGSRGCDAGIDAGISVSQTIAKIKEQTPAHASFGTKKSALVILRKIGKSIALGG